MEITWTLLLCWIPFLVLLIWGLNRQRKSKGLKGKPLLKVSLIWILLITLAVWMYQRKPNQVSQNQKVVPKFEVRLESSKPSHQILKYESGQSVRIEESALLTRNDFISSKIVFPISPPEEPNFRAYGLLLELSAEAVERVKNVLDRKVVFILGSTPVSLPTPLRDLLQENWLLVLASKDESEVKRLAQGLAFQNQP